MSDEIKQLLAAKDYESAAELLEKISPEEAAQILSEAGEDLVPLARALESDTLAGIIVLLDAPVQEKIVEGLHDDELQEVMEDVSVEDTVDIIEDMPETAARRIAEE